MQANALSRSSIVRSTQHGALLMIFYQQERIALFIDGANLYAAARGLAFDIDYRRLLDLFGGQGGSFAPSTIPQ